MKINLIPPEDRVKQRLVRPEPILAVVGLFVLVAAVLAGSLNRQQMTEANRRVESLQRMVAQLQPYQDQLAQVRAQSQRIQKALEAIDGPSPASAALLPLSNLLQMVADAAERTGTLWLTSLKASPGRLQLEGLATDATAVTNFLTQLTATGLLQQTQGGMSPVSPSGAGIEVPGAAAWGAPGGTAAQGAGQGTGRGLVRFTTELRVRSASEVSGLGDTGSRTP